MQAPYTRPGSIVFRRATWPQFPSLGRSQRTKVGGFGVLLAMWLAHPEPLSSPPAPGSWMFQEQELSALVNILLRGSKVNILKCSGPSDKGNAAFLKFRNKYVC